MAALYSLGCSTFKDAARHKRPSPIEDLLERDGLAARARRETVDTTRA